MCPPGREIVPVPFMFGELAMPTAHIPDIWLEFPWIESEGCT